MDREALPGALREELKNGTSSENSRSNTAFCTITNVIVDVADRGTFDWTRRYRPQI